MEPRSIEQKELKIVGLSCRTTMSDNAVPQLWQSFSPRMSEIKNRTNDKVAIGICLCEQEYDYREFDRDTEFTEISGVEVDNFNDIPDGMVTHIIKPMQYAVFTHRGNVFTMQKTYDYIYGTWLPGSNEQIAKSDTLEWYDERFISPEDPNSECDIYIPIK